MPTLREKYHEIGNKLNKIRFTASFIKSQLLALTISDEEKILFEKTLAKFDILEKGVIEADQDIIDLKNIGCRFVDPDVDIGQIWLDIKKKNSGIKIFVLEDEEEICEMIKISYERRGFIVDFAVTGETAFEKIKRFKTDIVLLDVHLPSKISGIDVLKEIKTHMPGTACVIVTKEDKQDVLEEIDKIGVEGILRKPVTLQQIDAKINEIITKFQKKYGEHH